MEHSSFDDELAHSSNWEQTMSRGPYPILLMLAMSLPGTVRALGLGEIRVDSGLNEPLSAQIDIVGASRDELIELTASVANREIFQRYGADRPTFLSSATFKVGMDAQGRPVLNVRSAEPFSDPLVEFLVELRWGKNELVREYSLLLDPPGLTAHPQTSPVAVAYTAPAAAAGSVSGATASALPADRPRDMRPVPERNEPDAVPTGLTHYRVASHDTLRGISRRFGARSESELQRMMIAIFRANPNAFDGNINRLHLGAELTIPSADTVAAVSAADARREVRAHMTAWRLDGRPSTLHHVAAATASVTAVAMAPMAHSGPATVSPAVSAATAAAAAAAAAVSNIAQAAPVDAKEDPADAALRARVQSLEKALNDVHQQLANDSAKIQDLTEESARAAPSNAVAAQLPRAAAGGAAEAAKPAVNTPAAARTKAIIGPVMVALALLAAGFVYLRRRLASSSAGPEAPLADDHPTETLAILEGAAAPSPAAVSAPPAAAPTRAAISSPAAELPAPAAVQPPRKFTANETTVSLEVDTEALERSYLDSLGLDPMGLDTVAIDTSDLEAAAARADLNTVVIDTKDLDAATVLREAPAVNAAVLDYNLLDLDATVQHVTMPSGLHDQPVVKERRTNIVDVLKAAIERDPKRSDLRMKLLETYYGLASSNQRAFLDVVRKMARERGVLTEEDWNKVAMMGKEIAPDDILFADAAKGDLANCA